MELLDEGICHMVCDSKLVKACKILAPKAFIHICKFHDMGNLLKNALGKNMDYYDPRAKAKSKVILSKIYDCLRAK